MQNDNRLLNKINAVIRVLHILFRTLFQQPATASEFAIQQHLVNFLMVCQIFQLVRYRQYSHCQKNYY